MKLYEKKFGGSGIEPLYDKWLVVKERNNALGKKYAPEDVRKFLLQMGLMGISVELIDFLSLEIVKSANGEKFVIDKEYAAYAGDSDSKNSLRIRLTYNISQNYDIVRNRIRELYGYDMGPVCYGNKAFIERLAMVYAVFYEPYEKATQKQSDK